METKTFYSKVASIEDRTVTGISAVSGVVDSGNDLIHKGAFAKTILERLSRVKHLWQHDNTLPPIAAIVELREVGRMELPADMKAKWPQAKGGLLVKRQYLETERGNEVLAGLKSEPPAITEMSFGYDAVKFDFEQADEQSPTIRNLHELRLWDTSDVNWGMNEATVAAFTKALPFQDTGMEKVDKKWDVPVLADFTDLPWEDLDDDEKRRIAAHYAWSNHEIPESFNELRLPHHSPAKYGIGPVNFNGCKAAMVTLMNIWTFDLPACHAHLAKHYQQFSQESPNVTMIELLWAIGKSLDVYKENADILGKIQELNELLRAEPRPVVLTLQLEQQKLLTRLELMKRQVTLASTL